ncbi:hypothetical protein [Maribacter flavus]|uniref:Uncharacterized protein n=1 Tax=Maribacter flavus TaxID=1658664 RepID=A0A5B2TVW9_9FLAO|nr:hypothetical protein [Maribacter flavus]KAA2218532.1 hypothetical protein F0361_02610 [Maribacter flavus]
MEKYRISRTKEKPSGISGGSTSHFNIYRDNMEDILRAVFRWSEDENDEGLIEALRELKPDLKKANWNPLMDGE